MVGHTTGNVIPKLIIEGNLYQSLLFLFFLNNHQIILNFSHRCRLPGGPRERPRGATAQVADLINGMDEEPHAAQATTDTEQVIIYQP